MEKLKFISSYSELFAFCTWLPHVFFAYPFLCLPLPPTPILCMAMCFSGLFCTISDSSVWVLMPPSMLLWQPVFFLFTLVCGMSVFGQRFLLDCKLLERRDAARSVIVFSVPGVIPKLCQLTVAQPTSDAAALSLECRGRREGKDLTRTIGRWAQRGRKPSPCRKWDGRGIFTECIHARTQRRS